MNGNGFARGVSILSALPGLWPAALLCVTLCLPVNVCAGEPAPQPTRYMIVVTGNELLSGVYADGHTYFITRTLRPLGLRCVGSMSVDDNRADLKEALHFATGKAPLVVVTGGLVPTDNDVTREALSDFTGIAIREHPALLREMARRFGVAPEELRANLRRQTRAPVAGTYLPNPSGTAVGLIFEAPESAIIALPGPPRELQPMVRDELVPYLSRRFGTRLPGCSLTLRFVGLGQSEIDAGLKEHVTLPPDVTVSSQFGGGRVDFTFALPDDTPAARTRLQDLKRKILKHLGAHIYAEGKVSLEQTVVQRLAARGETLALAEVGSGGSVTAALSDTEGADRVLAGAYIAPTAEKLRHLLDVPDASWSGSPSEEQKTERLAAAAARAASSQWAVAIGDVARDAGGVAYAQVVFRAPDGGVQNRQVRLRGAGEMRWLSLTTQLLDHLRRQLK